MYEDILRYKTTQTYRADETKAVKRRRLRRRRRRRRRRRYLFGSNNDSNNGTLEQYNINTQRILHSSRKYVVSQGPQRQTTASGKDEVPELLQQMHASVVGGCHF